MAARKNPRQSSLSALLLLVGACRHYGWELASEDLAGVASKGLGAAAILCLIWLCYHLAGGGKLVLAVAAWWSFEELQVVLCTAAWAIEPWHVPKGKAMCSAKAGFDIGAITVIIVSALAVAVTSYSARETEGNENVR